MAAPRRGHPITATAAGKLGARRCFYAGVTALAYPARSGYVTVELVADRGYGSTLQRGTAP